MNENNFNGEKIKQSGKFANTNNIGGIRDIDVPKRKYLRENKFKEIDLKKTNSKFWKKLSLVGVLLGIVAVVVTYFFSFAEFRIKNELKEISFNNDILKANNINTKDGDEIPFKLLEFDFSLEKDVKSKLVEEVSDKAVGKIKIINNTNKVQKLRKETRFETDGKIFKTYKSVTIPANSSVIREAFADEAGEEYNLKKGLKMTIPGFKEVKDMDSYKKITGEIAEDFTGGFVGKKDVPDKEDLENKKKILSEEIDSMVMIKARTELPKGYILNTDGIFKNIDYSVVNNDGVLKLVGKTNVKAIIFNEKDFLAVVSGLDKKQIEKYNIKNTAFLKFKILNKEDLSIDSLKSFDFELNGKLKYNVNFNKDEFIKLVKGKDDKEYKKIIEKNYSEDGLEITKRIFPFWLTKIPSQEDRISVEIIEE